MDRDLPDLPFDSPVSAYVEQLHRRFLDLTAGEVASYIPELAKVDPSGFGIVLATVDGRLYEVGDTRRAFTIQSISKPLVYGIALEDCGAARVRATVGAEPTGDAFNSISLEAGTGRPLNPMINAGAIACSSLVGGDTREARLARVVDAVSAYAGRPLSVDEAVFESERETGHRNRAIGHMLRNYDIVTDDPDAALELYFKQCSLLIDCRDLALMAATLANGGLHPLTRQRAVKAEFVGPILSLMSTCGMYDFAGEWMLRVGMPAKSGVGGGIIAVLPGQLGIGVYSPRLDARGNSVRGVKVCEALAGELGLHFTQPQRASAAAVRARYTLASVRSKRRRPVAESRLLDEHGSGAAVWELQGDLRFPTVERVLREVVDAGSTLRFVVLDFKRVELVDAAAGRLLARLIDACAARGQHVVLTRVRRGELLAGFDADLDPRHARALSFQPQLDLGLEWCERELIARHVPARSTPATADLADHQLCAGMRSEDVAELARRLVACRFPAGAVILRCGEPADALYLLMRGEVSVVVELPQGASKRLSTLSAGMVFGESAMLSGGRRSADVRADAEVECFALGVDLLADLERERPNLVIRLLHNLLRATASTAVRLTAEVAALEG